MFGFGKKPNEIEALKKAHQDQINKMNSYFSKERETIREKNNLHWEAKLKSTIMNFEKVFLAINENLKTPEARRTCIKTFERIIKSPSLSPTQK